MSRYLRKCIDIAPTGVLHPGAVNDYRELRRRPWWPALLATTSYVRMWADWPSLEPVAGVPLDAPENPNARNVAGLDEQIRLANADGLRVMLIPYRYPPWANGTAALAGTPQDPFAQPEDRIPWRSYEPWLQAGGRVPFMKDIRYRLPDEGHGPGTAWAGYVERLWRRYVAEAELHGRVHIFEVVNEPNLQLWPQRTPVPDAADLQGRFGADGTVLVVPAAVAEMVATMDALSAEHGHAALCVVPSLADRRSSGRPRLETIALDSSYGHTEAPFVDALLEALDEAGFAGGDHWAWSHHDYGDVERDETMVMELRRALAQRWPGRRLDGGPAVYCTEGGCRLNTLDNRFGKAPTRDELLRQQAFVVTEAVTRHRSGKGAGAGVAMLTQYTTYADPNYDCGLLEKDGTPRPSLAAWSGLPEWVPDP